MTTATVSLPEPPRLARHPLRWTRDKIQTLGTSLFLGHVGVLAVVGLYYLLFQTVPAVKYTWDHLLSSDVQHGGLAKALSAHDWSYARHLLRNVGEGLYGAFLAQQVVWNPLKKKLKDKPGLLDRIELRLHVPSFYQDRPLTGGQLAAVPLVAALYAVPGFLLGYAVVQELHHLFGAAWLSPSLSRHPSLAQKLYTDTWDQKVVGFVAGVFMARRPMKPVYDFVVRYFARRKAVGGKPTRPWHTPGFRLMVERYRVLNDRGVKMDTHGRAVNSALVGGSVVTVLLAGLGFYVLQHLA